MSIQKPKIRLYVPDPLNPGAQLQLMQPQSHYLTQVMRADVGTPVLLFNGRDGEWQATITRHEKKYTQVLLNHKVREQQGSPDVWLVFAPIKGKTDVVIEKATELGVSRLVPVITQRTIVRSINMEKMQAHAIEAAEQCGRVEVPELAEPIDLSKLLGAWPKARILLFADENGSGAPIKTVLSEALPAAKAMLVGPEGGFSPEEARLLKSLEYVKACSMGARILRADTASVAALACLQAFCGDWDKSPRFE